MPVRGRTFGEACRSSGASWSTSGPCQRALLSKACQVSQPKARLCSLSASRACGQTETLATLEHARAPAEQQKNKKQIAHHESDCARSWSRSGLVIGPVEQQPQPPPPPAFNRSFLHRSRLCLLIYLRCPRISSVLPYCIAPARRVGVSSRAT